MCGRFVSFVPANWNVAPSRDAMTVRQSPNTDERHIDQLRWGLIPRFTKDLKAARKPINARPERPLPPAYPAIGYPPLRP